MSPSCVRLFVRSEPALRSWLARSFPRACPGLLDDALGDTCVALTLAPEAHDPDTLGETEVLRRIRIIAWRALRGTYRRRCYRARADVDVDVRPAGEDPHGFVEAAETLARIENLVQLAARHYGGRRPERLAGALRERLVTADTDTAVAERVGLPRETLNQARRWLERRLEAKPPGSAEPVRGAG